MPAFQRCRQALIVACQSPETTEPAERSLDDPASRQQHEAALRFVVLDDDEFNPVFARGRGSDDLTNRCLYGDQVDQQLGRVDWTGSEYEAFGTLNDHLGSVRDVIDNTGTVKDSIAYDGFGNIQSGELNPSFRGWYAWTGRELDQNIDLQYNHARWYDSSTGRWISQDPMGFDAGDSNVYRYVNNRPTIAADPNGMEIVLFVGRTNKSSGVIDSPNGHVSVIWVGDGVWAAFDGGGGSLSGSTQPDPHVQASDGKRHFNRKEFSLKAESPDAEIDKALDRIIVKGTYDARYKDTTTPKATIPKIKEGFSWKGVVTSKHKDDREELRALFRAFLTVKQVPYHATGPNSNTYARELLKVGQFDVADRFTDYLRLVGPEREVLEEYSLNPADSYAKEKKRTMTTRGILQGFEGSKLVGPTSTPGWSNDAYK